MLLRFDGLAKNRFFTRILIFHGARCRFQILKSLGNSLRGVRNHSFCVAVDLQQRTTAWTRDFELGRRLSHTEILPQGEETSHQRGARRLVEYQQE